ncbi:MULTISPECIES: hypothetical protein [unclassified Gordonia (in: high G+C Gram-positive bacteria)]|uniref:hypothetical protein n=1 Tax=unclassified Gordonia (in: high G+C Gram-positive bacteria) TaxID=2657482 RepID=UPI001F0F23EE|nr:hypothetical protein [Gordonia sp. ABSL49_1]MCH5641242.1 hypothetical protein [Gordonia sp. ABSL49_1]
MGGPRTPIRSRFPAFTGRGETVLIIVVALLLTCLSLAWSYHVKVRCGGDPFDADGRSQNFPGGDQTRLIPCYSDIMQLWLDRDVDKHVFPYIHGGIHPDGTLYGGVVEYPVLSGLLIYLGAIGAHTDTEFFQHTIWLLTPFAFLITVLLALMARWWVLLWVATPPLMLYAFHNWELPVVATTVGAIAVMAWGSSPDPRTGDRRLSLRTSAVLAAILLAIGFCLKLYPGLFVLPLALYVLYRGDDTKRGPDWRSAGWVVGAASLTTLLVQLPFIALGFDGWKAAWQFQGKRTADATTNSVWYWGLRFLFDDDTPSYDAVVGVMSPLLILAAFAVAIALSRRRQEQLGYYPWIGVAASMLAGFMLFHKVHSPQYTLWLLPFFVLLQVRWQLIAVYLVADLVLDISIFRYIGFIQNGWPSWVPIAGVSISVWVHAVILALLIVTFVRTPLREPLATMMTREKVPA